MAKKNQPADDEVTGPRLPASDHRNHCLICGGVADHVHSPQPEKPEPKAPRKPKPDPDEPTDDDDVLVVELDPELLAAMGEAGEVEIDVELEPATDPAATGPEPHTEERQPDPQPDPQPEPAPEPNRTVTTKRGARARK